MNRKVWFGLTVVIGLAASSAQALPNGFVEDFTTDNAGWRDDTSQLLGYEGSGGVGGVNDGFVRQVYDFTTFNPPVPFITSSIQFRANALQAPLASGGGFQGDWIGDLVSEVRLWFRHDAPVPLETFVRVLPSSQTGAVAITLPQLVPAGVWTELIFPLSNCETAGGQCASVLTDVSTLQVGVEVPFALRQGPPTDYNLDLDLISIVPEPGTALLMGLGLAGLATTRRREDTA